MQMTQENELQMLPESRKECLPGPLLGPTSAPLLPPQLTHCTPQVGVPEEPATWGGPSLLPEWRKEGAARHLPADR